MGANGKSANRVEHYLLVLEPGGNEAVNGR